MAQKSSSLLNPCSLPVWSLNFMKEAFRQAAILCILGLVNVPLSIISWTFTVLCRLFTQIGCPRHSGTIGLGCIGFSSPPPTCLCISTHALKIGSGGRKQRWDSVQSRWSWKILSNGMDPHECKFSLQKSCNGKNWGNTTSSAWSQKGFHFST